MDHSDITRFYAIFERHDEHSKWHLHIGFSTRKSYNSDYKWWKKGCEGAGFKEPALDIHYHNNLLGLVGGYCSKAASGDRQLLGGKGFTDEQLEWGKEQYERGLRRQRVKNALDELRVINKDKFDAAVGYQQAELGILSKEEAIASLVEDGWAFSQSVKNTEAMYKQLYLDRQRYR